VHLCLCNRRRCKVEQVVPCGAANVVNCNGLSNAAAAAAADDDDDDDVICLDDEPVVKPNHSQHSTGYHYFDFCIPRPRPCILHRN